MFPNEIPILFIVHYNTSINIFSTFQKGGAKLFAPLLPPFKKVEPNFLHLSKIYLQEKGKS
jgi:hypothetical protein